VHYPWSDSRPRGPNPGSHPPNPATRKNPRSHPPSPCSRRPDPRRRRPDLGSRRRKPVLRALRRQKWILNLEPLPQTTPSTAMGSSIEPNRIRQFMTMGVRCQMEEEDSEEMSQRLNQCRGFSLNIFRETVAREWNQKAPSAYPPDQSCCFRFIMQKQPEKFRRISQALV